MRLQTSVMVSLLLTSAAIGLHQVKSQLLGTPIASAPARVCPASNNSPLCHRGSGRLENNFNLKSVRLA
ncbi:hypothetical protein ACKFKG_23260 [Phormidesmis sp. 146-35]